MTKVIELLNAAKSALNVETDYALAKALGINKARISAYYAGKETPNEFACLQIANATGKDYSEVSAIVRIEAEKDESRRQKWREYYKSIGGYAAGITLGIFCACHFDSDTDPRSSRANPRGRTPNTLYYVKSDHN